MTTTTQQRRANVSYGLLAVAASLLAVLLAPAPVRAAAGQLDRSFGGDGKVLTGFGKPGARASSVTIDARGRIVAAGDDDVRFFAIARYKPNGHLDRSFSDDGKVRTHFGRHVVSGQAMTIDSSGRIVMAGGLGDSEYPWSFALARYSRNGQLDRSFGSKGKVKTNFVPHEPEGAFAVDTDSRDRVVVAGFSHKRGALRFTLVRYKRNGRVDRSFGIGGRVTTSFGGGFGQAFSVKVDRRGRIVAAGEVGSEFALARYRPNGHLDRSFSGNGKVTTSFGGGFAYAYSLAIDRRGRLVAGGTLSHDAFALARYTRDGNLDPSFGAGGKVLTDFDGRGVARGVGIDSHGRIVAAGHAELGINKFALARYTRNGDLDSSFSSDGKRTTEFGKRFQRAYSVALDARDRIVAAGAARGRFALARYIG